MKSIELLALVAALLAPAAAGRAQPPAAHVGDSFEIVLIRDSSEQGDGSSGSSHDQDSLVERVTGVRSDGLELEYDLPKEDSAERGAIDWQFPVRVFRRDDGIMQILNRGELEARIDAWLKTAKLTRAACGRWYFTWNAFRVECDPETVLQSLKAFDLRSVEPREGALYRDPDALAAAPLTRKQAGPDGSTWAAELQVDPERVRRGRAEEDVALGEIMKQPVTLESALARRSKDQVSGTISITFDIDPDGNIRRRTKLVRIESRGPGGEAETRTVTETLERRRLGGGPATVA